MKRVNKIHFGHHPMVLNRKVNRIYQVHPTLARAEWSVNHKTQHYIINHIVKDIETWA